MQVQVPNFYDITKFSNTFLVSTIALETYFIRNLFREDGTRVIYASEQYAFKRRLDLLSRNGEDSVAQLQLPFMSYWRDGNFKIDDRPAIQNATASLVGFADDQLGGQVVRFLQVQTSFTCVLWMNSDLDAQMAHEQLLWAQNPSAKQWKMPSAVAYQGLSLDIPIIFSISDIQFNPTYTEQDWLRQNRVFPIKFTTTVRTVALSQLPQTPGATQSWDVGYPVITQKVFLDFLSYKGDTAPTTVNITDEVSALFDSNMDVAGQITVQGATETSLTVQWYYNPVVEPLLTDNVTITLNGGAFSATVNKDLRTYTFTDLPPQSTFNIAIFFYTTYGKVNKYMTSGTTSSNSVLGIKGILGY